MPDGVTPVPEVFEPTDPTFKALISEANLQGFGFVDRFAKRWETQGFRFDRPGEMLLAIRTQSKIVAFSGICFDPYSDDLKAGRIRHLYVMDAWRGKGFGQILLTELTRNHQFSVIRLRADGVAANFYEHIGWTRITADNATHMLPQMGGLT